jgi:hypothetical protein
MPKPLKKTKHPKDMTTDEALHHIFHPKVVEHVKGIVAETFKTPDSKPSKRLLKKG